MPQMATPHHQMLTNMQLKAQWKNFKLLTILTHFSQIHQNRLVKKMVLDSSQQGSKFLHTLYATFLCTNFFVTFFSNLLIHLSFVKCITWMDSKLKISPKYWTLRNTCFWWIISHSPKTLLVSWSSYSALTKTCNRTCSKWVIWLTISQRIRKLKKSSWNLSEWGITSLMMMKMRIKCKLGEEGTRSWSSGLKIGSNSYTRGTLMQRFKAHFQCYLKCLRKLQLLLVVIIGNFSKIKTKKRLEICTKKKLTCNWSLMMSKLHLQQVQQRMQTKLSMHLNFLS